MSVYEVMLFAHIIGVAVWLGGSIMLLVLSRMARAAGSDEALGFFNQADTAANRLMPPAAIVVVLAGIYMVIDAWSFSDLWVTAGLAMFVLSLFVGMGFYSPEGRRIRAIADEHGSAFPEVTERIGRYLTVARIEVALLTVVVLLMVVKP